MYPQKPGKGEFIECHDCDKDHQKSSQWGNYQVYEGRFIHAMDYSLYYSEQQSRNVTRQVTL
jgi:hypothetical protein